MSSAPFRERYGPRALVAGASEGLGAAFADALARRGLDLVLIARREEQLTATADRIRQQHGVDVITLVADLADIDAVLPRISALDLPIGPFGDATPEQLSQAAAVNVRAPLLLTKALSAPMIAQGRGGIVLMSSLAGSQGSPNISAYAATKAFNAILAEGLWSELKPHGVDVLACLAGAILTPGYQQAEGSKPAPGTLAPEAVAALVVRSPDLSGPDEKVTP